ncbi:PIG-L family deacetylase [Kitasatospora sp. NPDC002965]|uniref:PIG-L deacetylase family protein n=1 Tax=Kitasatospora sp. NPDC002965 TaxID=3154775 RepID=UPI0033B93A75
MTGTDTALRHVVVSPHPDDAVWSLGGRLARWTALGAEVTVVTVFDTADGAAGHTADTSPGHRAAHRPDDWRRIAEPATRRREDRAALAALGVTRVSLGLTDAALRTSAGRPRYTAAPRVLGRPHPDDGPLPDTIAEALRPWCSPGTRLHAPLAAGRHVDHALVRAAAERLAVPGTAWYEDFPYPLRRRDHDGLVARCEPLTPADLERWLAGAEHYTSQALALFGGPGRLREALGARARGHGAAAGHPYADRYWQRPGPTEAGGARQTPRPPA